MEPLATTDELRLPFEMDEGEIREAERAIEELSDEARYYGSSAWETPAETPRQVIRLVLKAAARHMKNYEGYITSRAGDETVGWSDRGDAMGDAMFNAEERKRLQEFSGNYRTTFHSVGMFHSANRAAVPRTRNVPNATGLNPVPYPEEPW